METKREAPDPLVTLTDEQLKQYSSASDEEIEQALERGREERLTFEAAAQPGPFVSRLRYR